MESTIFFAATTAIVIAGLWHSWWHTRRTEKRHRKIFEDSKERGLDIPISLHPIIDPDICMGSGACVRSCPEHDVLGLISARGALVTASNCIGHGRCAASCPVDAISLVFGTAKRGVELPAVSGTFETSVPGMYIAGELGGMGLIANAFEQAIQSVDAIAKSLKEASYPNDDEIFDIAVIGAGPAGVAGSLRAKELGLRYVCLEQETWGGAVRVYPRNKIVMTRPIRVPLYGPVKLRETTKEALLELWDNILKETGLEIRDETRLLNADWSDDHFVLKSSNGTLKARRVLLGIGRRGTPRKLGVPGEDSLHVATRMIEPKRWTHKAIVVIGGGDVAVEAALTLSEQDGTTVTLIHRSAAINRPKAALRDKLEAAQKKNQLRVLLSTAIVAIEQEQVVVRRDDKSEENIAAQQVFICIGGQLPTQFLVNLGIKMVTKFGEA